MKIEKILKGICVIALIIIAVSTAIIALDTLNIMPEEEKSSKEKSDKTGIQENPVSVESLVSPPDYVVNTGYEVPQIKDIEYPSLWESIFT